MGRVKLLLELIKDVRAVADDLQSIADAMASDEPDAEPEQKDEPEETIRLEDIRAVLAA